MDVMESVAPQSKPVLSQGCVAIAFIPIAYILNATNIEIGLSGIHGY